MQLFSLTLNMPSKGGYMVHLIFVALSAETMEDFHKVLDDSNFILAEEYYRDTNSDMHSFYSVGDIVVNTSLIGKVKVTKGDAVNRKR